MSNLINKVKGTLGGNTATHDDTTATDPTDPTHSITTTTNTTTGPHKSDAANKLDPRVDSDRDASHNLGGGTGTYNTRNTHSTTTTACPTDTGKTTAGPHSSNIANKLDPRVDSDRDGRGSGCGSSHTAGSANVGPHSSNVANKLDPRVDSDKGGHNHGTHAAGTTGTGLPSNVHNVHDAHNTHSTAAAGHTGVCDAYPIGTKSTDHGAHSSNIAKKLDPAVDSDRDHRAAGVTGTHGIYGTHATGTGVTGTTTSGPHSSAAANKLDPRVGSGRDHCATGTAGAYGSGHTAGSGATHLGNTGTAGLGAHSGATGTHHNAPVHLNAGHTPAGGLGNGSHGTHTTFAHGTGTVTGVTGTHSTNNGPHSSKVANKLDPRVDSDRDNRDNPASTQSGPAPNTAGPHKSDLLNKLDPRVDSDLDGSRTIGDKAHAGATGGTHTTHY